MRLTTTHLAKALIPKAMEVVKDLYIYRSDSRGIDELKKGLSPIEIEATKILSDHVLRNLGNYVSFAWTENAALNFACSFKRPLKFCVVKASLPLLFVNVSETAARFPEIYLKSFDEGGANNGLTELECAVPNGVSSDDIAFIDSRTGIFRLSIITSTYQNEDHNPETVCVQVPSGDTREAIEYLDRSKKQGIFPEGYRCPLPEEAEDLAKGLRDKIQTNKNTQVVLKLISEDQDERARIESFIDRYNTWEKGKPNIPSDQPSNKKDQMADKVVVGYQQFKKNNL